MKLHFLGKTYDGSVAGSPSQETGETGTFLGKTYRIRQSQIAQRHSLDQQLTYRGVSYNR